MTRTTTERLLMALSALILIGAALWWYFSGEYEERAVYRPDNSKLRTERFHVTERWLDRQGFATESLYHLQDLDRLQRDGATLIIPLALGRHNDLEAEQLAAWVENGGHLIAPAPPRLPERPGEHDLNRHGIQRCNPCPDDLDQPSDSNGDSIGASIGALNDNSSGEPSSAPLYRRVLVPGVAARRLWGRNGLQVPDETDGLSVWTDKKSNQPVAAHYFFGAGRVTLLPTTTWLDNDHLIYPDHARFLLDLIDAERAIVYLQQRSQPGGFVSWLWRQAPALWPIVIVLGLLWIWSRLPRLGPVRPGPSDDQRQMRDHVLATARFDWRHHRGANLIAAMREERRRRLLGRFPDWHQLEPSRRLDRLERLCPKSGRERLAWYLSLDRCDSTDALDDYVRLHRQLMHVL